MMLLASGSSLFNKCGAASITYIFVPNIASAVANSQPIAPPPIIAKLLGGRVRLIASL
jgi:hypothetical protein